MTFNKLKFRLPLRCLTVMLLLRTPCFVQPAYWKGVPGSSPVPLYWEDHDTYGSCDDQLGGEKSLSSSAAAGITISGAPTIRMSSTTPLSELIHRHRGGGFFPSGYNPFGYKITTLGEEFLKFDGSLDSDVGRFLASIKDKRKSLSTIKSNWLEIVRVSKSAQSMRIYRTLEELVSFCLKAGLLD